MGQTNTFIGRGKSNLLGKGGLLVFFLMLAVCFLMACKDNSRSNRKLDSTELNGIKIGNQVWSATNLDVVTFRNGDSIPQARSNQEWEKAGQEKRPAWCFYQNDIGKGKIYGRMYNWYAVDDARGLAPKGWHIPTHQEWILLETYLGLPHAGLRLKCNRGWHANGNGDNSSSFCLLPGGYRSREGGFTGLGEFTYLSGVTEGKLEDSKEDKLFIWGRGVHYENSGVMRCGLDKEFGLYVRCIKDEL